MTGRMKAEWPRKWGIGAGEADLEDPGPGSWSHPSPRHLWSIRRKRGNFLVQEESKIGVRS